MANVGPLIAPTTKAQYQAGSVPLPPQLFSHNDQQDQWHSLRGKAVSKTGWAGRIADLLASQVSGQQLALNVSLSGNTLFQAGQVATPYIMGASGRDDVHGHGLGGDRHRAQDGVPERRERELRHRCTSAPMRTCRSARSSTRTS